MKVALIGLRGTGKSTVGKILAERLGWPFLDTDTLVQERAGLSIRELFEKKGEPEFRRLEREVVLECAAEDAVVIATGGGAVVNPESTAALKKDGFVVHLSADPAALWTRISQDRASQEMRPKLLADAESGIDELKRLLLARAAVYASARDVEVDVETRTPNEIVEAILLLMRVHGVKTK